MASAVLPLNPATIKLLERPDLDAAVGLFEAQLREHRIASTAQELRTVIETVVSHPEHGFMLLASVGERPVGVAYAAALLSLEHAGIVGWVEELYVVPDSRGVGIGSALLNEVLSRAVQSGWKGVELELIAGHERAGRLYVRHGFHPLARRRYSRIFTSRR